MTHKYNGHRNWNYWNVALWIGNEEWLYRMCREMVAAQKGRDKRNKAAVAIVERLKSLGIEKTPDGAPYTVSAVRVAIIDL